MLRVPGSAAPRKQFGSKCPAMERCRAIPQILAGIPVPEDDPVLDFPPGHRPHTLAVPTHPSVKSGRIAASGEKGAWSASGAHPS